MLIDSALVRWRERTTPQLGDHGRAHHQPQQARDAAEPGVAGGPERVVPDQHVGTTRLQRSAGFLEGWLPGTSKIRSHRSPLRV